MSEYRVYIAAVSKKHFIPVFILLMGCSLSLYSQDTVPSMSVGETADSTLIRQSHFSHYFVIRCILGKPYSSPPDFIGTLQLTDMSDYETYLQNAPTCVKLEYDSSSGRYREALVEWDAVRK